jgi:signal transduction histidine kinase
MEFENEQLNEKSRELAAVQERTRLARELHDSVSQTIFTTSAMSEAALRQWDTKPEKAHALMEEVHNLAVTALAEMRVLLLELRPSALTQTTLKQVFEQYLTPLLRRHAFTSKLDITDVPLLPPNVQIAFYRIAQEAINNIVKHAHAEHVRIAVDMDGGDKLVMSIEDDGVGFDANEAAGTSLGLGIMEERAREIGALTQIDSLIGRGTRIRVIWNWVDSENESEED